MLLHNKTVAIIGGGPVGLTMARLLQQKGAQVTVYERDENENARIWGGPLDLHKGSGQKAMEQAGLLQRYYNRALPMGRTIADEQGTVFFSKKPTPEEAHDSPEINRNHLRQLLLESLAAGTVVWDRKCTGLSVHNGKWVLHFQDQPDAVADVVIGANGGLSAVRSYVTSAGVEYTGSFIIQGEVHQPEINCPEFYALCNGNILMAAANGITFAANPKNGGVLSYGVSFRKPEGWLHENGPDFKDTGSIADFLSAMFSCWGKSYRQLFKATTSFVGLPARKVSLDIPWKNNRPLPITLIGDAAHIMPPFAGQGVNTGLVDALTLSANLTDGTFDTVEAAISDYERQMFIYARAAQLETDINEIAMHEPGFTFTKRFSN